MSAHKTKIRAKARQSVEERLVEGEKVVKTAVIHTGIYWKAAAVFVIAVLLTLAVPELGIFLGFVAVLMAGYATIRKEILLLVLTDKRILVRYGILQVDVVDIHFDKIESIELERMPTGYMMGYANVVILGTGNRYIVIPFVANGVEIRQAYNELTLGRKSDSQAA
jgi:hypothetical protein